MNLLSDNDEAIWKDLQDGTVVLVWSPEAGEINDGRPLEKKFVNVVWGPLEPYNPESD